MDDFKICTLIPVSLIPLALAVSLVNLRKYSKNYVLECCAELFILLSSCVIMLSCFFTSRYAVGLACASAAISVFVLNMDSLGTVLRFVFSLAIMLVPGVLSFFPDLHPLAFLLLSLLGASIFLASQFRKIILPRLVISRGRPEVLSRDIIDSIQRTELFCLPLLMMHWDNLWLHLVLGLALLLPIYLCNCMLYYPDRSRRPLDLAVSHMRKKLTNSDRENIIRQTNADNQFLLFSSIDKWIREEKAFLNGSLSQDIVAERFCTNRTYVAAAVQRYSGMSYSEYVNEFRLDYALELAESNPYMTVAQLAMACGYPVPTTFTMAFKRRLGITPGAWLNDMKARRKKSVSSQTNK